MKFEYREFPEMVEYHSNYEGSDFTIIANNAGVRLSGETPFITDTEQLLELERVLGWAMRHHVSFKETGHSLNQDILTAELEG